MKNFRLLLSVMAIFIFGTASSQVSVGIKGGVNFASTIESFYVDAINNAPTGLASFYTGVYSEIHINDNFSFQPEINYTRKGFSVDQGSSFDIGGFDIPFGARINTHLDYIEAPLLAKLKLNTEHITLYGIVGPSIGYATRGTLNPQVTVLIPINLPSIDIDLTNNIYERTEVSGVIGGGIEIPVGDGMMVADIRYQHGFTNVLNDPIIDVSLRNQSVQLGLGYSHKF